MIKRISQINFGWDELKASKNRMPQNEVEKRQSVKNITLEAEKLDYFIKKHYGVQSPEDYKKFEMRILSQLITTLKHTEQSIIQVLKKQDNHLREKHNIKNNDDYICPINKEIHMLLEKIQNKDEFDKMKL